MRTIPTFALWLAAVALALAGYFDFKTRNVPEILLALLWVFLFIEGLTEPVIYMLTVLAFTAFYFFLNLYGLFKDRTVIGQADLLAFPAVFGFVDTYSAPLGTILLIVSLCAAFAIHKNNVPWLTYMCVPFLYVLLLQLGIVPHI